MSFKNILGHEPAIRLLKGQLTRDRLAHTYLFVGQRGIGKRTLGLEFIKAAECENPSDGDACDSCEACTKISQQKFPDLMVVKPEKETGTMGIDQIRALSNWLSLTPYQGRWKAGVIDEADRLTEEAANACLKMLEEPPEKSLLILVGAAYHRLPPTVLSRCHIVRFSPQGIQQVSAFLQKAEGVDMATAQLLAAWSGGRAGTALEYHREKRLSEKNAVLDQVLAAHRQQSPEIPLGSAPRAELEEALEWTAAWWRDLLLAALGADPAWWMHQDRAAEIKKAASTVSVEQLLDRIEWTYWVQELIQRNASPRIALSTLLCRP